MPVPPESASPRREGGLDERLDALATWVNEIDTRVRAAELRTGDEKTAKELRRALEALAKHDPKLEDRLTNRVDVLADRLSTLATTVSTTAAALAGREGELAGVRRDLDESGERIEKLMRELGRGAGSTEVDKLRKAIEALSNERRARTRDGRVDELGGKVDYLAERLDTLAKTVATTASSLVRHDGDVVGLRQKLDEGSLRVEQAVAEVRRLQGESVLTERLDSLQSAVVATTADLARREDEVTAVRARIDEAYARVGTVVSELQRSLGALSAQVAALEQLPASTGQELEVRAAELNGRIDGLGERLDALAQSVELAVGSLADKDRELAAVHQHVEDAGSRVEAVVTELREALAALPEPGTVGPEVEARLAALAATIGAVTEQLAELDASSSTRAEEAGSRVAELERLLAEVSGRLATVERERDAAAAELGHAGEAWAEERAWVRTRLEALTAAQEDATQAHEGVSPVLETLAARLEVMEGSRDEISAQIARVSEALDVEKAALQAQLDDLASALSESASNGGADAEGLLADLAARVASVEQAGAAVASEISRATAYWSSEHGSIEARLDEVASARSEPAADAETGRLLGELADRLDAMERDRDTVAVEIAQIAESWVSEHSSLEGRLDEVATHLDQVESEARDRPAAPAATSADEVAQLRVLIDGLRMRLASSEKELTALAGTRDVGARVDELTRRVDSVERAPVVVATAGDGPSAGDGRFRLELRALELRMEHAEAASRENREAVLVQLERLAARIEWRFQRLEAEHAAVYPDAASAGAQVVPIRGAEV